MKDIDKVARYFSQSGVLHADNCNQLASAARAKKLTMNAISRRAYPGQRLADHAMPGYCRLVFGIAAKCKIGILPRTETKGLRSPTWQKEA